MRVILLTHGQCEAALERLLAIESVVIAGIFVETDILRRYRPTEALRRSIKYEGWAATLRNYARKLLGFGNSYDAEMDVTEDSRVRLRALAKSAHVPLHLVANYHTDDSRALMRAAAPDLGVIYGTNIIKETVFKIPRLGSVNVHQGLAPWYRGGPPVFWELYNGEREVGITVHFVEPKVDSGEIVLQQTLPLNYDYAHGPNYEQFLSKYQVELQKRCASLLAESVRLIAAGTATPVPQDPQLGTRYRLPTKAEKDELRRRLRCRQIECGEVAFKSGVNIYQEPRRTDEASSA
jgi:folate-dependent phosphoribosylglycinamide formyltransferase PurN